MEKHTPLDSSVSGEGLQNQRALEIGREIEHTHSIAKKVVELLTARNLHIATVESCTGGGVAYFLTNIPGASETLKDSFVAYSDEAKVVLGISEDLIREYSAYSPEVAVAMAEAGIRKSVNADIGVGVTGTMPEARLQTSEMIPGAIYLAVKYENRLIQKKVEAVSTERFDAKQQVIDEVLKIVLEIVN